MVISLHAIPFLTILGFNVMNISAPHHCIKDNKLNISQLLQWKPEDILWKSWDNKPSI